MSALFDGKKIREIHPTLNLLLLKHKKSLPNIREGFFAMKKNYSLIHFTTPPLSE